ALPISDRELAAPGRLHQRAGGSRPVGRVGQNGAGAHVAPRRLLQAGSSDDQAGLSEQLGRPHRQQSLVTGARTDQRDPSLCCFLTSAHDTSFPLFACSSDTLMRSEAPDRSSSAARSRPSCQAPAAGAPRCARSMRLPSGLMTATCIRSCAALLPGGTTPPDPPAEGPAYAPLAALQPAARASGGLRSAVTAATPAAPAPPATPGRAPA